MVTFLLLSAYVVLMQMIVLLNERDAIRVVRAQQSLLENELETEKEYVNSARQYRHDMKQHARVLFSYLEEERYNEAVSYLKEYDRNLDKFTFHEWCENRVVNALLRIASRRIAMLGGEYSFSVIIPDEIGIPKPDLTVIFGNILENAYESCCKTEHPFITVNASADGKLLSAEIRNSVKGRVLWRDNRPKTTKKNGGTGMRNVRRVLSVYGGMLDLSQEDDVFVSRIILPMHKSAGQST